ncbi:DNA polymerase [Acidocella sp.]|uniref:DNA polymerase n=1 Tax=Acidocella sp. TaxID=50710 RepID=UPI003CFDAB74
MGGDFKDGVWAVDFEYRRAGLVEGNALHPVCLVARELISGKVLKVWQDDLRAMTQAPFPVGEDALFVAYNAAAEMACFKALGWRVPANVLDLYAEFRNLTNGLPLPAGNGLVGALAYFGEPCMDAAQKDAMRDLVLRGGPWSDDERGQIIAYCEADVMALQRLFLRMEGGLIDQPRALLRGGYTVAAAAAEHRGVPIDTDTLAALRASGPELRAALIEAVDANYGVFEDGHFRATKFGAYLADQGISWPMLQSGGIALDKGTFREMARVHPQLRPLHQLRETLVSFRELKLAVGDDSRNRSPLFPFSSLTGRNQPSTTAWIFGLPSWLRGLIRPEPGMALAYIDFSQQELAIAAARSGDEAMQAGYRSGDFYLHFAAQAGAVPAGATKTTHPVERERFKVCALGVLFGMTEHGLARKLGISLGEARQLLLAHRRAYSAFWRWSDGMVDSAMLTGRLRATFGWTLHVQAKTKPRTLRNFPMQADGAEMLRIACIMLEEAGIRVCAPVHDAVLIEAPLAEIDGAVARTQAIMREASTIVLGGFQVGSEAKIIRPPGRFLETKNVAMWNQVMGLLGHDNAVVEGGLG